MSVSVFVSVFVFVFAVSSSLIEISAEFSIKFSCALRFVSCKYLQPQLCAAACGNALQIALGTGEL